MGTNGYLVYAFFVKKAVEWLLGQNFIFPGICGREGAYFPPRHGKGEILTILLLTLPPRHGVWYTRRGGEPCEREEEYR